MVDKPTIAIYWAASCGGCEVALLNLHQHLLDLAERCTIVFCPCLLDVKTAAISALPDNAIDITLFNGAIRNSENAEMARLLRRVSRTLVAFGSCAHEGCVPGLSNLHNGKIISGISTLILVSTTIRRDCSLHQKLPPGGATCSCPIPSERPTLADHVPVDMILPGCPPESQRILELLNLAAGKSGPPADNRMVSGSSTVCAECPRTRDGRKVGSTAAYSSDDPDETHCLLEQGIVCRGVATREGCGALCPRVNMPCSGCYGAPEGMLDQGADGRRAGRGHSCDRTLLQDTGEFAAQMELLLDAVPDYAGRSTPTAWRRRCSRAHDEQADHHRPGHPAGRARPHRDLPRR